MKGVLIVGAGQSGLQTAVSLRELGYPDPIVMIGNEEHLPYQRPPLSKAVLTGSTSADALTLRTQEFLDDRGIEHIRNERVAYVDADEGLALTVSGREFTFDRLVLATGARVRQLPAPGTDLDGVVNFRDLSDAHALLERLTPARDVVVIGGGYIGLEVAASCRTLGKSVTVVEASSRVLGRVCSADLGDFYREAHERRGVEIRLNRSLRALAGSDGAVQQVLLDNGDVLPADVVVIGVGVQPRIELALQLGLTTDRGAVVVDSHSSTSHPKVLAVGDCTTYPHPRGHLLQTQSVQHAVEQGRNAAAAIVGQPVPYAPTPWFWSDMFDLKLQIVGHVTEFDTSVLRGDMTTERFSIFYYDGGRLVGAAFVNQPADFMRVRRRLGEGGSIPADQVGDSGVPLADMADSLSDGRKVS